MQPASAPWQAIAVAVCMLGLSVSDRLPLAGKTPLSVCEATSLAVSADEIMGGLLSQPLVQQGELEPIERFLYRLREFEEPFPRTVDLTWPSLIVDPCVLTEGMDLARIVPVLGQEYNAGPPELVLVLVLGDSCGPAAFADPMGSGEAMDVDASIEILGFVEMAFSSDETHVLYCDSALITGSDHFFVLSPVQSAPVTFQP